MASVRDIPNTQRTIPVIRPCRASVAVLTGGDLSQVMRMGQQAAQRRTELLGVQQRLQRHMLERTSSDPLPWIHRQADAPDHHGECCQESGQSEADDKASLRECAA